MIFEIEAEGEVFEVDAPDQATALAAFNRIIGGDESLPAAVPEPAPMAGVASPLSGTLGDIHNASRAAQSGMMQGMTFGFGDELLAGMATPIEAGIDLFQGKGLDLGRSYGQALDKVRGVEEQTAALNPTANLVGEVAGSVGSGIGAMKSGLTLMKGAAPTALSVGSRAAAEGGIYGALHGLGSGDSVDDRFVKAAEGSLVGAMLGGVTGGVAGSFARKAAAKAMPSVDDLKSQAGALYDAASAKGVTFPQPAVKQLADDVTSMAMSAGIDPTLHPGATAALKRLIDAGQTGLTVKDAQILRRVLAGAGKDPMNPDQARIAGMMVEKLDDFTASVPELASARGIYHQAKKGELIEQTIELAGSRAGQFSGSGFENALRTEFRALERKIIKGQIKGLTDAEKDAIIKVAQGGPIENALRFVGKLAPTGVVSLMGSGGVPFMVGNAIGGPALGAAAAAGSMGIGMAGRTAATRMASNNAQSALATALMGGKRPVGIPKASQAIIDALLAGEGSQAHKLPGASGRLITQQLRVR